MHCLSHRNLFAATLMVLLAAPSMAQSPRQNARQQQQLQERIKKQMQEAAKNAPVLPSDPQLLLLHKEFIAKAEKLAVEYERKKEFAKAREVYESLTRLVPNFGQAEAGLNRILESQSGQDRKLVEIEANKEWQDTGAILIEGMPVKVEVQGTWKVVYETGPTGIEIPEKMRPRDNRIKLGTLIGVLASTPSDLVEGRPFALEPGKSFKAPKTGRLFLRMFDVDPSDNEGSMMVQVQSTFATTRK